MDLEIPIIKIQNMGLEEYDSFALKSYSFALHKTNSFFSLPTLLLSLLIMAASVLINFSSVRHLWLPIQQIGVDSSLSLEIPEALTSTLLCIKPLSIANVGKFRFIRSDNSQVIFPHITESQVALSNPKLYSQIGRGFECVDLKGLTFKSVDDFFYITVNDTSAQMYIKGSSFEQVFNGDYVPAAKTTSKEIKIQDKAGQKHFYFTYIKLSILDSLYMDAQPQIYNTVRSTSQAIYTDQQTTLNGIKALFSFSLYKPRSYYPTQSYNYNIVKYNLARKSIAYIIGAVLSWVSIFILIIGFIASPIMDCMLSLRTAESLFYLQPQDQKPSLFKFCIASLKSGIFKKEDKFVRMCEKVDRMKDVGVIVKLQMLLARLFPSSQHVISEERISSQHSFNQVTDNQSAIHRFKSQQKTTASELQLQEDEQDVSLLTLLRKKLLYFFDTGSQNVSIKYSKGGIGSECSFIVTVIVSIGFLCFLILFGVFSMGSTRTQLISKLTDVTYTTFDSELVLNTNSDALPKIFLMDGTYKKLSQLTLIRGVECTKTMPPQKLQQILSINTNYTAQNFYCFPSFTLQTSKDLSQKRIIGIDMSEIQYNTATQIYQIAKVQSSLFQNVEIKCFSDKGYKDFSDKYKIIKVKLTNINQDGNNVVLSQFLPMSEFKSNIFVNRHRGSIIELLPEVTNINVSKGSIFDVVQSVWSLSLIVFTVIVLKLTKYINLKQKHQIITSQKSQFRDSICVMLSRIDGLLKGRQSKELENLKYYIKQKITLQ